MKYRPWIPGSLFLLAALTMATVSQAQAPTPGESAEDNVQIPDSRGWTVEQAVVNLRSSDKGTRLAALFRLAPEHGPSVQKWIAEAAQYDPEARIRYEAVTILGKRNESASLPILMHIADNDKDDRVRTAARTASGMGVTPANAPPPGQPATPVTAPAPTVVEPAPVKRYDANGNELPPGYMDEDIPAASDNGGGDSWGASVDVDEFAKTKKETTTHSGFMPQLGYDGPMGSPRDTITRTNIGLELGFGRGVFNHAITVDNPETPPYDEGYIKNEFTNSDFSLLIEGYWSPVDFLEIGLEIEALTAENSKHRQKVFGRDSGDDWIQMSTDEDENSGVDRQYSDAGFSGAAFGLLALDIKTIFVDTEKLKLGLAIRVGFPTHTGDRFDKGIGAHDLFLPVSGIARLEHYTKDATFWGIEPGIVASFVPVNHLTISADIMFSMGILKYTRHYVEYDSVANSESTYNEELDTINMLLTPHLGIQYRFLDESLGVQLALSPAIYLGKSADPGLAAFGIIPGISYRIKDMIDLALTIDIQAGGDASKPYQCTDLISDPRQKSTPTTACGVGRTFGMALHVGYDF